MKKLYKINDRKCQKRNNQVKLCVKIGNIKNYKVGTSTNCPNTRSKPGRLSKLMEVDFKAFDMRMYWRMLWILWMQHPPIALYPEGTKVLFSTIQKAQQKLAIGFDLASRRTAGMEKLIIVGQGDIGTTITATHIILYACVLRKLMFVRLLSTLTRSF